MKPKFFTLILSTLLFSSYGFSQNLVINPGAESATSSGWTIVTQGTSCYGSSDWRIQGNQNGFPVAHSGTYFFFSGCNKINGQIYQDIDVSNLAGDIDMSNRNFTFIGYMQVYADAKPDQAQMIIEYRNASDVVIVSYNTGLTSNQSVWTPYTSTITAPVGTRKVRIKLISKSVSGSSVDAYFDDISLTSTQILPLQLISFNTVVNDKNEVVASWKTATELNNDHFELQRSVDGISWETVASVRGAGTSSTMKSYAAIDRFPITGNSFYRLAQYDLDGKFSVSKVNSVKVNGTSDRISVYPNPAVSRINIEGNAQSLSGMKIFDATGQNVTSRANKMQNSSTQIQMDVSQLPSGVYFIKAGTQTTTFYKK